MKKLIVSSGNQHKIKEIKNILNDFNLEIISKDDLGYKDFDVLEDGETLEDNAVKKAVELSKKVNGLVVADDTGLFVDALDGAPGVYSSRYAGEDVSYEDNNNKLLKELNLVPEDKRTAKFITVIALASKGRVVQTIQGECSGKIAVCKTGKAGFGYDPLFVVDKYNKTFAELGDDVKNNISHRANALRKLREQLKVLLEEIKDEDCCSE